MPDDHQLRRVLRSGAQDARRPARWLLLTPRLLLIVMVAAGCVQSPRNRMLSELAFDVSLQPFAMTVTLGTASLIDCFPAGGTFTARFDPAARVRVVEERDDDSPAMVVTGDLVSLRPAAFAGADTAGWWSIPLGGPDAAALERVVGPAVSALVLSEGAFDPAAQVRALVGTAEEVRGGPGPGRFRLIDRPSGAPATVIDVELDPSLGVTRIAVAAEAAPLSGSPDPDQPGYIVRYAPGPASVAPDPPEAAKPVGADELNALDVRPGACGVVIAP